MCFSIERNIVVFITSIFWLCYSLHRKQRLTFKHWKSGWGDKTLQKWLQFGLSRARRMCTEPVFSARHQGQKRDCFIYCSHSLGKMSGRAQPVTVFTMNCILMKMDVKERRRLHFVSKKEERRQMGVSQRPADRHTKCFWGWGGGVQRPEFPPQRWSRWAEAGTGAIPQLVMSPG